MQVLTPAKSYSSHGDSHGSEVPFVFGYVANATQGIASEQFRLSLDMGHWWTGAKDAQSCPGTPFTRCAPPRAGMARQGSPNSNASGSASRPVWTAYTRGSGAGMNLRFPEARNPRAPPSLHLPIWMWRPVARDCQDG